MASGVFCEPDKQQGIYIPLATDTEVNNCFSILKNVEIIEYKKVSFLLT